MSEGITCSDCGAPIDYEFPDGFYQEHEPGCSKPEFSEQVMLDV